MAKGIHRAMLKEGAAAFNAWRSRVPAVIPDLDRVELSLAERQFGRVHGGPINFSGARLCGAQLEDATLSEADFSEAALVGAVLTNARLDGAQFAKANLSGASCDGADFAGARFAATRVAGARLGFARNLTQQQIDTCIGDSATELPPGIKPPPHWPETTRIVSATDATPGLYDVLGVRPQASNAEIREAYRARARALHPDLHPGDHAREEVFKALNAGMAVLRNPQKRKLYSRGDIDASGQLTVVGRARAERLATVRSAAPYLAGSAVAGIAIAVAAMSILFKPQVVTTVSWETGSVQMTQPDGRIHSRPGGATVAFWSRVQQPQEPEVLSRTSPPDITASPVPEMRLPDTSSSVAEAVEAETPTTIARAKSSGELDRYGGGEQVVELTSPADLPPVTVAPARRTAAVRPRAGGSTGATVTPRKTNTAPAREKASGAPERESAPLPARRREARSDPPAALPFGRRPCKLTQACMNNEEWCSCPQQ